MDRRRYKTWTKTPVGGTYYLAVILLDLILFVPLVSSGGSSILEPRGTSLVIGITIACLLVLLYSGAKRRERKHLEMHGSMETQLHEVSRTKKILEDFIFPPLSVWVITAAMGFAAGVGVDRIPSVRIIALTGISSLLMLLYPLARRACTYRR